MPPEHYQTALREVRWFKRESGTGGEMGNICGGSLMNVRSLEGDVVYVQPIIFFKEFYNTSKVMDPNFCTHFCSLTEII